MYRNDWDVQDLIGKHAQVRLIDDSSFGWGHINFDDLKYGIICNKVDHWIFYIVLTEQWEGDVNVFFSLFAHAIIS